MTEETLFRQHLAEVQPFASVFTFTPEWKSAGINADLLGVDSLFCILIFPEYIGPARAGMFCHQMAVGGVALSEWIIVTADEVNDALRSLQ